METILFEAVSPYINASLFGYETPKELFEVEYHKKDFDTASNFLNMWVSE